MTRAVPESGAPDRAETARAEPGPDLAAETIALGTLLTRLGDEIGQLGGTAAELDELLGENGAAVSGLGDEAGRTLQRLDLLRQSLGCLAQFLDALAAEIAPDIEVRAGAAARALTLGDLAAALTGGQAGTEDAPAAPRQSGPGEVHLF